MTPHASYFGYVLAAYLVSALTLVITAGRIYFHYRKVRSRIQVSANK